MVMMHILYVSHDGQIHLQWVSMMIKMLFVVLLFSPFLLSSSSMLVLFLKLDFTTFTSGQV